MAEKVAPIRRGVPRQFTFDEDALGLLASLAAHRGAQGRLLSELVRAEVSRREERQKMREAVLQALSETTVAEPKE